MMKHISVSLKGFLLVALTICYGIFYFLQLIDKFSWWNLAFIPLLAGITAVVLIRLKRWSRASLRKQYREDWGIILCLGFIFFVSIWSLNGRYRFLTPLDVFAKHKLEICPTTSQKNYRITDIYTKGILLYEQGDTRFLKKLKTNEINCSVLEASWDGPIYLGINTKGSEILNASIWLDHIQYPIEKPVNGTVLQVLHGSRGDLQGKKSFGLYWGTYILVVGLLVWLAVLTTFALYFLFAYAFLENDESFSKALPSKIDWLIMKISEEFHQWLPELFILVVIIASAYGLLFVNNLMIGDDWILLQGSFSDLQGGIGKGRWLRELMRNIYDNGFPMPSVSLALALIGCLVSARIQAAVIGLKTKFSIFSYVAVFVLYPIWTEPMMFNLERGAILVSMIAIALCVSMIAPVYERFIEKKRLQSLVLLLVAGLLFSIVAAGGQNFILIGIEAFIFALLLKLIRMQKNGSVDYKLLANHFLTLVIVAMVGLIFYVLEFKFSLNFYQITESTGRYSVTSSMVSSLPALLEALKQLWGIFVQYFFLEQYYLPAFTKYIFLVFLVTTPSFFVYQLVTRYSQPKREKGLSILYFIFIWFLLLISPWGIALIRNADHWNTYRYNAMLQLATFAAGVVAISLELVKRYWLQKFFQLLSLILIVVYAFQINKASMIMYYNNQRDLAIAQRVLDRIELLPGYSEIETVNLLILGSGDMDVQQGRIFDVVEGDKQLETKMGNLASGCGVWDCHPYLINNLLWLLSSQDKEFELLRIGRDTMKTQKLLIKSLQENPMRPWPEADSIRMLEDKTVVLLVSFDKNQNIWSKVNSKTK